MEPKQIAQRWFDEIWNKKNPDVIAELMEESATGMSEGGPVKGPAEFRKVVFDPLVAAFPDFQATIDGLIGEGGDVVVRWTATATHTGPFAHLSGSGKKVKFSGMTWLRFAKGKIVAGADSYNLHGLLALLATDAECATVRRADLDLV